MSSKSTENVYQNIIDYCEVRGLTIKTFEEFCGLGNGLVRTWDGEKKSTPSLETLDKIQAATGIPVGKWVEKGGAVCAVKKSRSELKVS